MESKEAPCISKRRVALSQRHLFNKGMQVSAFSRSPGNRSASSIIHRVPIVHPSSGSSDPTWDSNLPPQHHSALRMLSTVCMYLRRRGAQSCTTIPNRDHISALDDTRGNPCACRARGLTCNYYCLTVGSWHDRRRLAARSLHLSSIVEDRELCNAPAQNRHGILQPHACPMPRPTPFVRPSAGVPPLQTSAALRGARNPALGTNHETSPAVPAGELPVPCQLGLISRLKLMVSRLLGSGSRMACR
jgi:hypothetical protein